MEAIILAGGLGQRLRSVISDRPKPMAPIANKPFLAYLLEYWLTQKVTRFILAVGYKHTQISEYFGAHFQTAEICYAIEESPLGTGGGLRNALLCSHSTDPILIINGDTFLPIPLSELLQAHQKNAADMTISARKVLNTRYSSLTLNAHQQIMGFSSVPSQQENYINGGVYLFNPISQEEIAHWQVPFSLENDLMPIWIKQKKIYAYLTKEKFIDIGIPESYREAESIISQYRE